MGLIGWPTFNAGHARPFIIFADLAGKGNKAKFQLLGSLLRALALKGDYALLADAHLIRILFDRQDSARAFAEALGARKTAREGGWAGQWALAYDEEAVGRIKGVLPPPKERSRQAGKGRRRAAV